MVVTYETRLRIAASLQFTFILIQYIRAHLRAHTVKLFRLHLYDVQQDTREIQRPTGRA